MGETERICAVCGRMFLGIHRARYCSAVCQKAAARRRYREKRRNEERTPLPKRQHGAARSIADVMTFVEQYKLEHGVYLSYGKAVLLMEGKGA